MTDVSLWLNSHTGLLLLLLFLFAATGLILLCRCLHQVKKNNAENRLFQTQLREAVQQLYASQQQLSRNLADLSAHLPEREEMQTMTNQQTGQILEMLNHTNQSFARQMDALGSRMDRFGEIQEQRLHRVVTTLDDKLTLNEQRMDKMRDTLSQSVTRLQEENSKKLEEMRVTVDEKLHTTLDKRLSESFSLVNERLEQVYKGLGEMQTLASGVGDLKRVLTNVKNRGVWGEIQLGTLLEQTLARTQYEENVAVVPNSSQRVEYAVKLPGQGDGTVYMPIDAKFPLEDYNRLQEALENNDQEAIRLSTAALQNALKNEAKRIASKYICPPYTTDFAIMFLPLEGLYAEALRAPGLMEELQEKQRIMVAGPTTLSALLTSLQVGFRTLAIEQRSGEVWQLLSAVKGEFGHFTDLLEVTEKRLNSVSNSIQQASRKSRTITRKLKEVEALDESKSAALLELNQDDWTDETEN